MSIIEEFKGLLKSVEVMKRENDELKKQLSYTKQENVLSLIEKNVNLQGRVKQLESENALLINELKRNKVEKCLNPVESRGKEWKRMEHDGEIDYRKKWLDLESRLERIERRLF